MTTKEFIEKVLKDETLNKKLAATHTPEEGYAVAREAGLTDDFKTFAAALSGNELSEAELDRVAGGAVVELQGWDSIVSSLSRLSRLMSR